MIEVTAGHLARGRGRRRPVPSMRRGGPLAKSVVRPRRRRSDRGAESRRARWTFGTRYRTAVYVKLQALASVTQESSIAFCAGASMKPHSADLLPQRFHHLEQLREPSGEVLRRHDA